MLMQMITMRRNAGSFGSRMNLSEFQAFRRGSREYTVIVRFIILRLRQSKRRLRNSAAARHEHLSKSVFDEDIPESDKYGLLQQADSDLMAP